MTDRNEKLGIIVEATDNASGKLSNVKRELSGIQGAATLGGGRFGSFVTGIERGAGRIKASIGGALSHAKSQLTGLATLGLTTLGVGGLFGIGAFFKTGLSKAREFGSEVVRLMDLTKLSAEIASRWAGTFEHFGIGADQATSGVQRLLTNVGKLTGNLKAERKWTEQFGFELRTGALSVKDMAAAEAVLASKHSTRAQRLAAETKLQHYFNSSVKDANGLILTAVDYWNNKSIPQTQKAAVLAKVLGKNWAEWLPILKAGRAGLSATAAELDRMGLKVTPANIKALGELKTAQRGLHSSLSALEIAVGLRLVPQLTKFTDWATGFLSSHSKDILTFFDNAAGAVETLVDAASRIPSGLGIMDMIKGAIGAWDSMPSELRDLLVKGVVADRSIKFLFGFSPIGAIGSGIGSAVASAVGRGLSATVGKAVGSSIVSAGLGKAFVQPVYVTNMGPGGMGGGGLPGGAAAGGMGLVAGSIALGVVAAAEVGMAELIRQKLHPTTSGDLYQRDNFTAAEQAAYHGGKSVEDINADREAISAAADRAHDDAERLEHSIKTAFGRDVMGGLEKVDQAIRSRRTAITVPVRVSVKDYAATHVRVFENGDATSSTSSSAQASTDSRFAGFTRGLAGGGRYRAGQPRLVGERGPELEIPDSSGWIIDANRTRRAMGGGGLANALGHVGNETAAAAIERAIERGLRRIDETIDRAGRVAKPAVMSARQAEGATARQRAYGPTRARQLAFAG